MFCKAKVCFYSINAFRVCSRYIRMTQSASCAFLIVGGKQLSSHTDFSHLLHHVFMVPRSISLAGLNNLVFYCCTTFPGALIQ